MKTALIALIAFALFFPAPAFAQTEEDFGRGFGPYGGFDMGLPESSAADPEYVAQEKFIEEMTTVYTWIASNSGEFVQGCKSDREALVASMVSVIQNAQETSTTCKRFEAEAAACNPEVFCSQFEQGMPMPPEMRSALKDAGYDPSALTINDVTPEMALMVCKAQFSRELSRMKEQSERMKEAVRKQIPEFRSKCAEFKKRMEEGFEGPRLPEFNFPMPQQQPQRQQPMQGPQPNYEQPRQQQDYYPQDYTYEDRPPENFYPEQPYQEPFPQEPLQGEPQPYKEPFQEPAPTSEPAPEPAPASEPAPAPEPAPEATTSPSIYNAIITGLATLLNFEGETEAAPAEPEPQPSETVSPEPAAQVPETAPEQQEPLSDYPLPSEGFDIEYNPQDFGPPYGEMDYEARDDGRGPKPYEGYGYNMPQQGPSQGYPGPQPGYDQGQGYGGPGPGGYGGPGMSPEAMCELSDEELVETFAGQSDAFLPKESQITARCATEASNIVRGINSMKLSIAKCKANAALDCAAKQESVKSCNELKENPENIAKTLVANMCRRFGVRADSGETSGGLYDIAEEFYDVDPALANQLGDTADKTAEDKKNLNFFSYVLGDAEYGKKLKDRAEKLKAVKERLGEREEDSALIGEIDEQIEKIESEGSQFENFFDFSRIGRAFEQPD